MTIEVTSEQRDTSLVRAQQAVEAALLRLLVQEQCGLEEIERTLRTAKTDELKHELALMRVRTRERERLYRIAYEACERALRGG